MSKKKVIVAFVFLCIAVFLLIEIPKRKQYVEEQGLLWYHLPLRMKMSMENRCTENRFVIALSDASLSMFNPSRL